jgi:hypothetical protein
MNHWIITTDFIEPSNNRRGEWLYASPRFPGNFTVANLPIEFRLYDGDGNLYYEGRMQNEDFDPLDDFGGPNAGCTEIKTRSAGGAWTTL